MTANDLATAGFIDERFRYIIALLQQPGAGTASGSAAPGEVVLYSVQKLAAVLDVHPETVRAWVRTGKRGRSGQTIKLQAFRFTAEPRIPWPALLAYERGEDFDLSTLPAPTQLPPEAQAPPPKLDTPAAAEPNALRVA
jgi:hypothetical protein